MSLTARHEPSAEDKPTIEDVASTKEKAEGKHEVEVKDNQTTEDIDTAEEKNLERLESAFFEMHAKWWPQEIADFDPTESLHTLESALWEYLANTKVIFDAGRLQEAETRCLKFVERNFTLGYCCVDALRLAARCTRSHDFALGYLSKALEECHLACYSVVWNNLGDAMVWVGDERFRLIERAIADRKAQKKAKQQKEFQDWREKLRELLRARS